MNLSVCSADHRSWVLTTRWCRYISKDGIWLLKRRISRSAQSFAEALGLEDTVVDFEITPNRPDCLSMIGMAREAAAVFGTKLEIP